MNRSDHLRRRAPAQRRIADPAEVEALKAEVEKLHKAFRDVNVVFTLVKDALAVMVHRERGLGEPFILTRKEVEKVIDGKTLVMAMDANRKDGELTVFSVGVAVSLKEERLVKETRAKLEAALDERKKGEGR